MKKVSHTPDSISLAAQPKNKRRRTSALAFRVARASAAELSSRVITIRKNGNGRRGYQSEDRHPLVNEELPDEADPDVPLPDLGQLDDSETSVLPQPSQSSQTKKQQNTVSVCRSLCHIEINHC